ncbi:DUF927 domain-containing protein [Paraburkholderia megapolitana]|uniref:DUF927 domain-containing protein n=1 Tax=Paraburkholderia megapolitana TaxID=420953 RepID=UPI0038B9F950
MSEYERARVALGYVPPDDRETWQRMGMALKAEFGEEAFSAWNEWSQAGASYNARDARDTWKSFKGGKITINTLFHVAKQHGFDPRTHRAKPVDAAERRRQEAERAQKAVMEKADEAARHAKAAALAAQIWSTAASAPTDHPYLVLKGIDAGELRIYRGDLRIGKSLCDGALIVPARNEAGELSTLEFILPNGQKRYLPDGRKAGCYGWIGTSASSTILIGEGYATCATLAAATGFPVAVAFDAGNLYAIAVAMRQRFPDARIGLCGDDDHTTAGNPGMVRAQAAADAVGGVALAPYFGEERCTDETDFNDMAARLGGEAVGACVRAALSPGRSASSTKADTLTICDDDGETRFEVKESGVWFHGNDNRGQKLRPHWICARLDVMAETRDENNNEWGYLLEFDDRDGKRKRWAVPARLFAGDGTELRSTLLSMGLKIGFTQVARTQIANYIQTARTSARARCAGRVGWHGGAFVLPDRTIGDGLEMTIFQADAAIESQFKQGGQLADWKRELAAFCVGNSRLAFCVSTAFAGTLLRFSGQQSGGFHLMGDSTLGKTTALRVAASVFGGRDYVRSWRATDNALELTAAQHCDTLLILDEIGQVDPKVVGDVVYMLANEAGKGRATRTAAAKPVLTWRLLFLSSGEKSLASLMTEANKSAMAGQDVRLATIPGDAGRGYGMFETLHDFASPKAFADHLSSAAGRFHGVAGIAFLEWASKRHERLVDALKTRIVPLVREWVPNDAHSQVSRVATRFALVGIAGELASEAGITGWPEGTATAAAQASFKAWLAVRGGTGNAEHAAMLRQVRSFFEAHGDARFVWWHRALDDRKPNTMHRAGFKRMLSDGQHPISSNKDFYAAFGDAMGEESAAGCEIEYYVLSEVFRSEVCKGFDHKAVARLLVEVGALIPEGESRPDRKERLPGMSAQRCYRFSPKLFDTEVA